MMPTLLAKKAQTEVPVATDDEAHAQLVADPHVDTTTFGDPHMPVTTTPGGFGNMSAGFGAAPTNSFGSSPNMGSMSGGFGSSPSMGSMGMQNNMNGMQQQPQQQNLTAGAEAAVKGGAESTVENTNTDWINKKWRPVMGWMYMMVCVCDFTIFPVLWSVLQALSHGQVTSQWQPLTLQGAGLFHVAMGAVLGIAAYGRTKEKIEGKS